MLAERTTGEEAYAVHLRPRHWYQGAHPTSPRASGDVHASRSAGTILNHALLPWAWSKGASESSGWKGIELLRVEFYRVRDRLGERKGKLNGKTRSSPYAEIYLDYGHALKIQGGIVD